MKKIRIYFDFGCPYCYLAWEYMKELRKTNHWEEEWYSWEIHPDAAVKGVTYADLQIVFTEERRNILNTLGADVKVRPGDNNYVFNTHMALQFLESAKEQKKEFLWIDRVYKAYFEEGRNVADREVLCRSRH